MKGNGDGDEELAAEGEEGGRDCKAGDGGSSLPEVETFVGCFWAVRRLPHLRPAPYVPP